MEEFLKITCRGAAGGYDVVASLRNGAHVNIGYVSQSWGKPKRWHARRFGQALPGFFQKRSEAVARLVEIERNIERKK